MKKLVVLLCLLLLLAGCGSATEPAVEEPTALPTEQPGELEPDDHAFLTELIHIGDDPWVLEGYLTLPLDASAENPVPAVVLVHGSGASDRNAAAFALQPFYDIASYLTENGIAVIRYDKRTYTHGAAMVSTLGGSLTVREETIEDAIFAAELLHADPRIGDVFLLGHSLGGMLAPRIAMAGGDFAGLILFAGSPRSLLDVILTQNELVLETLDGPQLDLATLQVEALHREIDRVLALPADEAKEEPFLGASAYYFQDLIANPFAMFAAGVTAPILVMHAENDFQVLTEPDFNAFFPIFEERDDVTFLSFPGLNHFFMPSTAESIADIHVEYAVAAQVDSSVLRALVDWIAAHAK